MCKGHKGSAYLVLNPVALLLVEHLGAVPLLLRGDDVVVVLLPAGRVVVGDPVPALLHTGHGSLLW